MDTSFLNRCRALMSKKRVLILAQTLCLTAIVAVFLAAPLVSMAACGGGGQKKVQTVKTVKVLGTILGVSRTLPIGATLLNGAVPIPGTPGGVVTVNPKFTFTNLKPGTWITGTDKGVPFQGTIFSLSKVNGNTQVAEVWVADPTPNDKGVKAGDIVKNVDLSSITAA